MKKYPSDAKGFILHPKTGKRILKNPRTAGEPRYLKLSGNELLSNTIKHARGTAVKALKASFERELRAMKLSPFPEEAFPLRVEWDLYDVIGAGTWDADNKWFYWKYFCDTMKRIGLIPDDRIRYITHPPAPRFFPVEDEEDRKFVFRFYRDERECIINHKFWRQVA